MPLGLDDLGWTVLGVGRTLNSLILTLKIGQFSFLAAYSQPKQSRPEYDGSYTNSYFIFGTVGTLLTGYLLNLLRDFFSLFDDPLAGHRIVFGSGLIPRADIFRCRCTG